MSGPAEFSLPDAFLTSDRIAYGDVSLFADAANGTPLPRRARVQLTRWALTMIIGLEATNIPPALFLMARDAVAVHEAGFARRLIAARTLVDAGRSIAISDRDPMIAVLERIVATFGTAETEISENKIKKMSGSTAASSILGPSPAADLMAARELPDLWTTSRSLKPRAERGNRIASLLPAPSPHDETAELWRDMMSSPGFAIGKNLEAFGLATAPVTGLDAQNKRYVRSLFHAGDAERLTITPLAELFHGCPQAWITADAKLRDDIVALMAPLARTFEAFSVAPAAALDTLGSALEEDLEARADQRNGLAGPSPPSWAWIAILQARRIDPEHLRFGAPWPVVASMLVELTFHIRVAVIEKVRERRAIALTALQRSPAELK